MEQLYIRFSPRRRTRATANVEDVEGEGSVQGNGPPQFNHQLNFQTLREYLHHTFVYYLAS